MKLLLSHFAPFSTPLFCSNFPEKSIDRVNFIDHYEIAVRRRNNTIVPFIVMSSKRVLACSGTSGADESKTTICTTFPTEIVAVAATATAAASISRKARHVYGRRMVRSFVSTGLQSSRPLRFRNTAATNSQFASSFT